ncbi:MAG: glycosyltransferase [Endomicrobium sp.]|jgi:glycosyltransferase involved in cell wall biosynthesis|uniref:glycosyltransferase family 2 protein n=1 Tax=Candidatus Endomicrobiellum cubanum TaxID=3242325 RepID=UPI00282F56DC|nr:glycosyltransferase [Endomicrobium sp.]
MTTPKVSVIIPVYNTEKYLKQCLDSVCNQTLKDIEIICVNDESTDSSLDILKEYANKDNRIIIINQKNLGAGSARNSGLEIAKGQYIAFVDSDDWINLNMLESLYNKAEKTNSDIVLFSYKYYYDNLRLLEKFKYFDTKVLKGLEVFSYKDSIEDIFKVFDPKVTIKFYKKSFVINNKLKFQNLYTCNDVFFSYASAVFANRVTYTDNYFYIYRINHVKKASRGIYCDNIFKVCNELEKLFIYKKLFPILEQSFYIKMKGHMVYEYCHIRCRKLKKKFIEKIQVQYYEKYFKFFFDGSDLDLAICGTLRKIFSVHYGNKYKVIIIFGLKIKFQTKKGCLKL